MFMSIRKALTLLSLLLPMAAFAQTDLLRFPALSPDAEELAFSWQGDIWVANLADGIPRRLTIHEAYESHPQWSPNGKQLVFQGNRYGNNDLFVVDADGSAIRRLTQHSASDIEARWDSQEQITFNTRRDFAVVERAWEIHRIPSGGGTPERMVDFLGTRATLSPDGRFVAFERGECRITREAYTGPAQRDIWLYDLNASKYHQITTFEGQDIYPDWGPDNQLYFLSAQNGRYNIHRVRIKDDGSPEAAPEALTNYNDAGIRHFDLSADGSSLVFELGAYLYLLPTEGSTEPQRVKLQLPQDDRFYDEEVKTYTDEARDYEVSPNGKWMVFNVRGELFLKPNDPEKKRSVVLTEHAWNDFAPKWLNDSTLLFISDRAGDRALYRLQSAEAGQSLWQGFRRTITLMTDPSESLSSFQLSPDRKKIALTYSPGTLRVADLDEAGALKGDQRLLLEGWDAPSNLSWSPDGQFLAYDQSDLNFNREVFILPADGSKEPANVSMHPRSDYDPKWSPDGSKLGFISIRNNSDADLWFVWLRKADWEKTQRDWEEEEEDAPADTKASKDKKDADEEDEKTIVVDIDFEGLYERLVQVTQMPGNEGNLTISEDGKTFFFTTNGGSRQGASGTPDLLQIQWDGKEQKTLQSDVSMRGVQLSADGKYLYYLSSGGSLKRFKIDGAKVESLPFQARMRIDYVEERKQLFNEAWRELDEGFYDPEFHGRDWAALREQYAPLCFSASTSQDFRDMFNELLGQLNASHMGMSGSDPEQTQKETTGLLGAELFPVPGGLLVGKVIPGTPADREGSRLVSGEVIRQVNLTPVSAGENAYALFNGTANERTLLEVAGQNGEVRELVIRPESSIRSALYDEWVRERREQTDRESEGRLGYLHIQGMNWPSFERFERELMAVGYGKEALVIDVRYNGGGWTTDMLMAVLSVRQHAYTVPRGATESLQNHADFKDYYPYGERLPLSSWTRPSIALCNQASYSNAEIFSHAYKGLELGTLVGMPTFGAVISTGSRRLIDGSSLRMPGRAWFASATGANMETVPAIPDILLENPLDYRAPGNDVQLSKAVETMLQQLEGK